ncbi:cytosine/adenosine deaminase-related metal-dependent hydrolase [Polymorphobacter multimanifer]|uniref:Cytosine/adenosine deaminase-related metal-dependent hydrolase n=1 Tax=Polymorphobacter multimanifer TaxID=1070431 RepID=A0A841LKN3_9SPHN|nr:amidohydrolase family protein [Polymorphobacter multimanifer]MBB6229538.1 cytosine/adenosine deaminase-related metal-dependent hydrolase [Polymorphobacter multimanifer]
MLAAPALAAMPSGRVAAQPTLGEYLIQGATVLTMVPGTPMLADHDVHVRGRQVVAVGPRITAPAAERIDARGAIVLPGLVDTHWHVWTTLLGNLADSSSEASGYFAMTGRLGRRFGPAEMRLAALLAAADAIDHGITTVHDWCHNIRSPDHARAALAGLRESGLRARFSYGATRETPFDRPLDAADFTRLHDAWDEWSSEGRLTLGLGWRGVMATVEDRPAAVPEAVWRADLALARDRGLPVSVHANNSAANQGHIRELAGRGLLGRDMQLVHAVNAQADEIDAVAREGASVSLAPSSEFAVGFGVPPVAALRRAGVAISASIDTPALVGAADLLRELRIIQGLANAQTGNEMAMKPLDALAIGTRGGAAALGLGEITGTLAPGKRADLIMVRRDARALQPHADPATLILRSVRPSDIRLVMVDGTILKRDGQLTRIDRSLLATEVAGTSARLFT